MEKKEKDIKQLLVDISAKLEDARVETSTRNEVYIAAEKLWSIDDVFRNTFSELGTAKELYALVVVFRAMQVTMGYPSQSMSAIKELENVLVFNDLYVFTKRQVLNTAFEYILSVMYLGAEALNTAFASVNKVITDVYDNGGFIVVDRKSR